RAAKAERIADRDNPVADTRSLVGERDVGEVAAAIDLDEREIGAGIGADHLGAEGLAIVHHDLDGLRVVHDVVVGHRVAVRADEETRTLAGYWTTVRLLTLLRVEVGHPEATEEALHRRVLRERRTVLAPARHGVGVELDADRDHGRLDLLHEVAKAHGHLGPFPTAGPPAHATQSSRPN